MPTFRLEKFTVTRSHHLAQSRIFFLTENEPISRCRRLRLKPERNAHLAKIQSKANSWYAIETTRINRESGRAHRQRANPRFDSFVRPIRTKNEGTNPFLGPRPPGQRARRLSQNDKAKPIFRALAKAASMRAQSPRRPIALAVNSQPAKPAYVSDHGAHTSEIRNPKSSRAVRMKFHGIRSGSHRQWPRRLLGGSARGTVWASHGHH
jgi:hypothetical protein